MTTLLRMLTDYGQSCQRTLPASSRRTIVLVRSRVNELDFYMSKVVRNLLSLGRVSFSESSMYAGFFTLAGISQAHGTTVVSCVVPRSFLRSQCMSTVTNFQDSSRLAKIRWRFFFWEDDHLLSRQLQTSFFTSKICNRNRLQWK